MSWSRRECAKCQGENRFQKVEPFGDEGPTYGVVWSCETCDQQSLDLCSLSPLVPRRGQCLNCDGSLSQDRCTSCGMEMQAIRDFVAGAVLPGESLAGGVNRLANEGLMRLAFNLLDLHLLARPNDALAWSEKSGLLLSIGFPLPALGAIDIALEHANASQRPEVLHLRADILCQLDRGEEALRDIDECLQNAESPVARNYTRGRALGLIGRLAEAIDAMHTVLGHDPEHYSAQRAIGVLRQTMEEMES